LFAVSGPRTTSPPLTVPCKPKIERVRDVYGYYFPANGRFSTAELVLSLRAFRDKEPESELSWVSSYSFLISRKLALFEIEEKFLILRVRFLYILLPKTSHTRRSDFLYQ
jgi:hypothetical protein